MSQLLEYRLPEHLAARRAAMRREWGVQAVAAAVAVTCFASAGLFLRPINEIRRERQLLIDPDTLKGLPPELALIGKLGTFRALAIDWAAIRAQRLKQEGKTYEALQLYQTICSLAPRFPTVWANAAWEMAYNISVLKYSPEARWKWVRNGIELLRDKGIPFNPRAVTLYKELAWIFWHKIGDFMDDEHLNYKRALAVEMETVLGAPPVALTDDDYFEWFQAMVEAPRDLDEFLTADSEVAALVARLDGVGLEPDISMLAFVARHLRPELRASDLIASHTEDDPLAARRLALLTEAESEAAVSRLLAAVRSQVLRERYHFDLDFMMELMELWGPLDWRNAFTHGLYWASLGDKVSRGHENINRNDQINNARQVLNTVQTLITKGRITLWPNFDDPFESYLEITPDTRYIPYLYNMYLTYGLEFFGDHPRFRAGTPGPVFMTGFVSKMHTWIHLLYLEGGDTNIAVAENFFVWLRINNRHPNGSVQERYLQTLDGFVITEILGQLQIYKAASAFIRSLIQRALKQSSLGLGQSGVTSLLRARHSYDYWMADTKVDINDRRKMQPFAVIVRDEISVFFQKPSIQPLYKARLWKHLPLSQRQMVYDHLRPYFERLCETQDPPWAITVAFGKPSGMEEFRLRDIEYRGKARREGVDEGERYKP